MGKKEKWVDTVQDNPWFRSMLFFLAMLNQSLTAFGHSPIPLDETMILGIMVAADVLVATVITAATGIWVWWKNNNFTQQAKKEEAFVKQAKKQGRL